MAFLGHIPYRRETDPKALFAQGLQNMLAGWGKQEEKKTTSEDIERLGKYLQYQEQLKATEALQQSLMGLSPEQRQQHRGPAPQWPAFQERPKMRTDLTQKFALQQMMQSAGRVGTLPGWWPYGTEKQKQDYMNRVGGPLVQVGEKLLTPEKRQEKAEKDFEKAMVDAPLTTSQITGYGEAMDTRLDKSKRHWIMQPGRINYPEKELFKQWKIFCGMHKLKNDTQKEQIWNIWQNKIKNRAAEGWFGKETDFDPTDPKWRKAIGLPTASELETQPTRKEPTGLEKTLEDRTRNEIGRMLLKMPKDVSAEIQRKVQAARQMGFSWQEIHKADDFKPYRGQ